jgi:hypothetical protein
MGIPRFALSLGICASLATSTALAQTESATTVSAPAPPPINDPTPSPAVAAERDRPRLRFDVTAGLAWFFNRQLFSAGPAIALGVGAQINDRWAVIFRAIAHSIFVFGGNHAQILAEWSPIPSAISLGFGAGVIHGYMFATSPCAGCPAPMDLSITAPIELAAYANMRRADQVERRGFRLALQAAPTLSVYNSAAYDTGLKFGVTATLQAGWALR